MSDVGARKRLSGPILIGGIPGSYKTSLAARLCAEKRIPVTGTDEIRAVVRVYDDDPFLQGKTHDRYQLLGDAEEYLLEGFLRQCRLLQPAITAVGEYHRLRGQQYLIEGVHIVPDLTEIDEGKMLILYLDGAARQLRRMQDKREQSPTMERWTPAKAEQAMRVQEMLIARAEKIEQAQIIDAGGSLDECLTKARQALTGGRR